MGPVIYVLCALTSLACAILLVRAWRTNRTGLLFWSSVCFSGLFVNNAILVIDKLIFVDVDLLLLRDLTNLFAVVALVGGLIWSSRS